MKNLMIDQTPAMPIATAPIGTSADGHPCAQAAVRGTGVVDGSVRSLIEAKPFPGPLAWSPPD